MVTETDVMFQHLLSKFGPFDFPMGSIIRSSDVFSSCVSLFFFTLFWDQDDGCSPLTAGRIVGAPCQSVNGLCFCLLYVTWGEFGGFGLRLGCGGN